MSDKERFSQYFREVQPKFSRFCIQCVSKAKLTMPQFVLLNLLSTTGTAPMTDLSEKLYISKPAVTNLVDRLEKNHYLKRAAHAKDRRIYLIQIQPKGEKAVREVQASILENLLSALDAFEPKERETITKFYALLSRTMDDVLASPAKK